MVNFVEFVPIHLFLLNSIHIQLHYLTVIRCFICLIQFMTFEEDSLDKIIVMLTRVPRSSLSLMWGKAFNISLLI